MRSTSPGTELDFLLKLTRQPKNNPSQERRKREREEDGRQETGKTECKRMMKREKA